MSSSLKKKSEHAQWVVRALIRVQTDTVGLRFNGFRLL